MTAERTCGGGVHTFLPLYAIDVIHPTKVVCDRCQMVWALTFLGHRDPATLMLNHVPAVQS